MNDLLNNVYVYLQGTAKPILKLSNLVVGDYTIILKVTDSAGQTSNSKVTVVVRPEKNQAPKAEAGSDKVITTLNKI